MHVKVRNVNEAFNLFVSGIANGSIPTTSKPSRAGDVLKIDEPVTITFQRPTERVLFNQARDCNPFFHVFESLWMLAGRNDVAPLKYYSSKIGDVASDDGSTFNGAYGWRWRKHPGKYTLQRNGTMTMKAIDQLPILIKHLKYKPESRRAVLQMWRVLDDLKRIDDQANPDCKDCMGTGVVVRDVPQGDEDATLNVVCPCVVKATKDVCCNTAAYFSLRNVDTPKGEGFGHRDTYLDMTVTNRSNDLIWGLLGANVVHFSFLQEYMACALGVEVGHYHQFANDLHVYTANNGGFKPEVWMTAGNGDFYDLTPDINTMRVPLVRDAVMFDREVQEFVNANYLDEEDAEKLITPLPNIEWAEPFLQLVAQPMCDAFHYHKVRDYGNAFAACDRIQVTDWRIAATNWIRKREFSWNLKCAKGEANVGE